MDILVVGGGGREHALIKKLAASPSCNKIYCCPGNGGIAQDAECLPVKATDIDGVAAAAREKKVGLVVVAPDDPLALGMVDVLDEAGFMTFGPRKSAAILESSKAFSKAMMKKYQIPTAAHETFEKSADAVSYLENHSLYPIVIKADGLALGKGVVIARDFSEAKAAVLSMMEEKAFGAGGDKIVIEEFLEGVEVTVLCFTDGETIVPMASSMDHKRALDGDQGLNTGGMGAVAPNPYYTEEIEKKCREKIFLPTIEFMKKEGRPFKGCLYFGLMIQRGEPYVIEYNARFGDPETQVVLPLLDCDLVDVMQKIHEGRLKDARIGVKSGAAACVVLASGGYPGKYETGKKIKGLENAESLGVTVYHAGTAQKDGEFLTAGGRVLGVTATAPNLKDALSRAYEGADEISFEGLHRRNDIGQTALKTLSDSAAQT